MKKTLIIGAIFIAVATIAHADSSTFWTVYNSTVIDQHKQKINGWNVKDTAFYIIYKYNNFSLYDGLGNEKTSVIINGESYSKRDILIALFGTDYVNKLNEAISITSRGLRNLGYSPKNYILINVCSWGGTIGTELVINYY